MDYQAMLNSVGAKPEIKPPRLAWPSIAAVWWAGVLMRARSYLSCCVVQRVRCRFSSASANCQVPTPEGRAGTGLAHSLRS